jgi:hypothetical protein
MAPSQLWAAWPCHNTALRHRFAHAQPGLGKLSPRGFGIMIGEEFSTS